MRISTNNIIYRYEMRHSVNYTANFACVFLKVKCMINSLCGQFLLSSNTTMTPAVILAGSILTGAH